MPSLDMPITDCVRPIRDWLIETFEAADSLVFKGRPPGTATPYIELRRVGGAPPLDTPDDEPLIQFDIRGAKGEDQSTEALAYALASYLRNQSSGTIISSTITLRSTQITLGPLDQPDLSIGSPRYIVDCRFSIITTS